MRWHRWISISIQIAGLWASLVTMPIAATPAMQHSPAQRIISLDYCADQYLLKFVEPQRIFAVSPDATSDFSHMRKQAVGFKQLRPRAEEILIAKPDLVIRSYGGGPNIGAFLTRAGIRVLQIGHTGSIEQIKQTILKVSTELGAKSLGQRVVSNMDDRLSAIREQLNNRQAAGINDKNALYMTPTGFTSGPGTIIHEMLETAGLENFQRASGWRSMPLERLVYESPDLWAMATFNAQHNPDTWTPIRHPVAQRKMQSTPTLALEGAWTSCGGWFLLDAIELLHQTSAP